MRLHKLEALLDAAEQATARPWRLLGWSGAVSLERDGEDLSGIMDPEDGSYAVQAANAAEDMARLLMEAYTALKATADMHDCDDFYPQSPYECPDRVKRRIEQRFGDDDEVSL